eukprot:m.137889 g.137889  ORF g.137889 m.137889 type:complete len:853 (-) comp12605_c0_seq1:139-2697(-)
MEEVKFDESVLTALEELFPSDDPLDDPEFDPLEYINELFPNEQSLSSLDSTIMKMKKKIRVLDEDLQRSVRSQTQSSSNEHALKEAQDAMTQLMQRIRDIRQTAIESEKMVEEITRDIKSLDNAKRNLTTSITTLNHLHMLIGGVDNLRAMTETRQYYDAANLLAAVVNVLHHFKDYEDVPQVREIVIKVDGIKDTLSTQIRTEFQAAFRKGQESHIQRKQMNEACAVLDVLDVSVKEELVMFFINGQLSDYAGAFPTHSEQAWLDKVDRRYAWFKRLAAFYSEHYRGIFPDKWLVPMRLALRFCEETQLQLDTVFRVRGDELSSKILLFSIQKTEAFETLLSAKFFHPELIEGDEFDADNSEDEHENERDDDGPLDDDEDTRANQIRMRYLQHKRDRERQAGIEPETKKRKKKSPFIRAISKVFGEHLHVYVSAQDETLSLMIEEFGKEFKSALIFPEQTAVDDENAKVLESAGDMFVFFRNSMRQCVSLSTAASLFELYEIFIKYLSQYAQNILHANLPKSASLATLLVKESELKLSNDELYLVACILNTANYSLEMSQQLEAKMKEKIDNVFKEKVDFTSIEDSFNDIITTCIGVFVRAVETSCVPPLAAIHKTKWDQYEEVGDSSLFVSQISKSIMATVPHIRNYLGENRKYFTNFCLKFANSFIPKILAHMKKCKSLGMVGAEQLLLDVQSLRLVLNKLPSMGSDVARKPPMAYTKIVTRGLHQADMLLKIVLAPHDAAEVFVQDFYKLLGESDQIVSYQKVLELKGLKKSEQQPLLTAFKQHATNTSIGNSINSNSIESSGTSKSTTLSSSTVDSTASSTTNNTKKKKGRSNINIRKLESLIKRFQ